MNKVMAKREGELERPAEPWKYVYLASAIDFGSNLKVSVTKSKSAVVGYQVKPRLYVSNRHKQTLHFIADFCEQHSIATKIRKHHESYRVKITNRNDIRKLLELVEPYLISRHKPAMLIVEELIPIINNGLKTQQEFIEAVKVADEIRELTSSRGTAKYDEQYFRNEWDL